VLDVLAVVLTIVVFAVVYLFIAALDKL